MRIVSIVPAVALLISGIASAASVFIRPTTVILSGRASAATLTVTNNGDTPVTAQLRLFAWNQSDNADQLTATQAVVASPPMMTIQAGQSQTIRLVRVEKSRAVREESYRLLVDEIPARAADAAAPNVKIQLRYSVPVFVMPKPSEPAKLAVRADVASNQLVFDAVNSGQSHAQISNVSVSYANGASQIVGEGLVGYVLPDKSRQWKLALPADALAQGRPTRVRAVVNGEELLVNL